MHSPDYTKRIKALIAAREELDVNTKRILFQFRTGSRVNPLDVDDAKLAFTNFMAVLEPTEEKEQD